MDLRVILFGGLAVALCACGKTDFGSGCEKAVELVAPWTEMSLPLEDGQARGCEVSGEELKLRSYTWKTKEEACPALKQALTAAGWAEDRCTEQGTASARVAHHRFTPTATLAAAAIASVRLGRERRGANAASRLGMSGQRASRSVASPRRIARWMRAGIVRPGGGDRIAPVLTAIASSSTDRPANGRTPYSASHSAMQNEN